jgi:hypothetical protein
MTASQILPGRRPGLHPVRPPVRFCPGGTLDNSPTLQLWVTAIMRQFRPEGTTEIRRVSAVPSGLIGSLLTTIPTLKRWAIPGCPFGTRRFCMYGVTAAPRWAINTESHVGLRFGEPNRVSAPPPAGAAARTKPGMDCPYIPSAIALPGGPPMPAKRNLRWGRSRARLGERRCLSCGVSLKPQAAGEFFPAARPCFV